MPTDANATIAGCLVGCLLLLLGLGLAAGITGGLFMLLWNWVVPSVFGLHAITFWQALGLWVLIYMVGAAFFSTVKKIQNNGQ